MKPRKKGCICWICIGGVLASHLGVENVQDSDIQKVLDTLSSNMNIVHKGIKFKVVNREDRKWNHFRVYDIR